MPSYIESQAQEVFTQFQTVSIQVSPNTQNQSHMLLNKGLDDASSMVKAKEKNTRTSYGQTTQPFNPLKTQCECSRLTLNGSKWLHANTKSLKGTGQGRIGALNIFTLCSVTQVGLLVLSNTQQPQESIGNLASTASHQSWGRRRQYHCYEDDTLKSSTVSQQDFSFGMQYWTLAKYF